MNLMGYINKGNVFLSVGVGGFLHELLFHEGTERPFILAASLAFAGLKWTLPADRARKEGDDAVD